MDTDLIFKTVCGVVIAIMIIYYFRREKKLMSLIAGVFTGEAALFILDKYGEIIGIDVPLNIFNVLGSAVLGVPFVVFIAVVNIL